MKNITIVGLGGSLRPKSTSLSALTTALEGAAQAGADTHLLDIRALDLPPYRPDNPTSYPSVDRLTETVAQADAMIWFSPLYHGSVSGAFKNAIDWLERLNNREKSYLSGQVVGLISTAGGTQGLQAINTMEFIVRALRGWAVPLVMPIGQSWKVFDQEGNLRDETTRESLKNLGKEVDRAARQFPHSGTCDYA
ncbi:NADPH-dependent FMN reductase [Tunicatimonas pelagia]|uniref:NADPH-dependent FMN reductase n=1 Tax=Tunicatimonas pelagia TaxID=931531 RepID=UPI002665E13C|nr:NAD(P)H-dependent oxidoreductase [Tunicatimonas pelagia]WKN44818.1 NAD(P)H-dependent oxidoreductase [Tunicatimonas pelagia]